MQHAQDLNEWIDARITVIMPIVFIMVVVFACNGWKGLAWVASQLWP